MAQIKKNAKVISMKMDKTVSDKLDQFCEETGLSRTVAVEKILDKHLDEYFAQPKNKRQII